MVSLKLRIDILVQNLLWFIKRGLTLLQTDLKY